MCVFVCASKNENPANMFESPFIFKVINFKILTFLTGTSFRSSLSVCVYTQRCATITICSKIPVCSIAKPDIYVYISVAKSNGIGMCIDLRLNGKT